MTSPSREDVEAALADLRSGLNSARRDDEIAAMLRALVDERDELKRQLEQAEERAASLRTRSA